MNKNEINKLFVEANPNAIIELNTTEEETIMDIYAYILRVPENVYYMAGNRLYQGPTNYCLYADSGFFRVRIAEDSLSKGNYIPIISRMVALEEEQSYTK